MSDVWVENMSLSVSEASLIAVVMRRHLKEIKDVLEMEFLDPFLKKGLEDEVSCVEDIIKKLNLEG